MSPKESNSLTAKLDNQVSKLVQSLPQAHPDLGVLQIRNEILKLDQSLRRHKNGQIEASIGRALAQNREEEDDESDDEVYPLMEVKVASLASLLTEE
jgi:hypothetical protein